MTTKSRSVLDAELGSLREDGNKQKEKNRQSVAFSHIMSHHAMEMDDPDAHMAAAKSHRDAAAMHRQYAADMEEAPVRGERTSERRKPGA